MNPPVPHDVPLPSHHPADELLLDYATGAASPAESLMIATHLTLCPDCMAATRTLDMAGSILLSALDPARMPPGMLNRTLAAINAAQDEVPAVTSGEPLPETQSERPRQIADHLAGVSKAPWRQLPGGFRMRLVVGDDPLGRVWLFDAPSGMRLMPHRHVGDEWTVILSGEFSDDDHCYLAGDFGALPDGQDHRPQVGPNERCVGLLMVRENPRYTTILGKMLGPFFPL
jgi:putative transcriptional regulator